MKNKEVLKIISLCIVVILLIVGVYLLFFSKKTYAAEIRIIDSEQNPSRQIVVLENNKEIKNIKHIKTIDNNIIDETYPFTINHTSIEGLNGKIKIVLKNNKEIIVKIK